MTKKEQLKVLNDKIDANRADFNLNRQTAKISALVTGGLDKYEYLTGEETNYRSNPVEQKRFEYSPLGKVFNKGLIGKDDGDDGVLKRLDKIGKTNQELLDGFNNRLAAIEGNDRPAIMGDNGGNGGNGGNGNNGGNNGGNGNNGGSNGGNNDGNGGNGGIGGNGGNGGGKRRLNKTEQKFKQYLINKGILKINQRALEIFDSIVEVRNNIKDKSIYFYKKNEKNDLIRLRTTKDFDLYDIVNEYIKGVIDKDNIINFLKSVEKAYNKRSKVKNKAPSINSILKNTEKFAKALVLFLELIRNNYMVRPNNKDDTNETKWLRHDGVDITWINDRKLFNKIANNLGNEFVYGGYDDELNAIKKSVQDINEGKIKNKEQATQNFRVLKTKIKNEDYIQNYMKPLEQALFGEN